METKKFVHIVKGGAVFSAFTGNYMTRDESVVEIWSIKVEETFRSEVLVAIIHLAPGESIAIKELTCPT